MKRIFAIMMSVLFLMLSFALVSCDDDEENGDGWGSGFDNPEDGTFGVDFDDLFDE